jgi:hypothetical protein
MPGGLLASAATPAYSPGVADAPAPPPLPAAIRITRPYASEDEYLDRELETLTRASITLLGAQARPQGVVLRFELALSSGQVLMRGEGRVVAFKANAFEGLGGLTLRFTRLDTRSKALVDRAATLREKRRPSTRPHFPDPTDPLAERGDPEPPLEAAGAATLSDARPLAPLFPPPAVPRNTPPAPAQASEAPPAPASPGRDSLLDRLRARARALHPDDIARILSERRRA